MIETIKDVALPLKQVQRRMLGYAETTLNDFGWHTLGVDSYMGGTDKSAFDKWRISIWSDYLSKSFGSYFVIEADAKFKRNWHNIGRTAVFHLIQPDEPDKLFSSIETAESFDVTSLCIDDSLSNPLVAKHSAQFGFIHRDRGAEIIRYFSHALDDNNHRRDPPITDYLELDWKVADEQIIRQFDSLIEASLDKLGIGHSYRDVR